MSSEIYRLLFFKIRIQILPCFQHRHTFDAYFNVFSYLIGIWSISTSFDRSYQSISNSIYVHRAPALLASITQEIWHILPYMPEYVAHAHLLVVFAVFIVDSELAFIIYLEHCYHSFEVISYLISWLCLITLQGFGFGHGHCHYRPILQQHR